MGICRSYLVLSYSALCILHSTFRSGAAPSRATSSKIRKPKAEARRNSDLRIPKSLRLADAKQLRIRISGFFRISEFELRIFLLPCGVISSVPVSDTGGPGAKPGEAANLFPISDFRFSNLNETTKNKHPYRAKCLAACKSFYDRHTEQNDCAGAQPQLAGD